MTVTIDRTNSALDSVLSTQKPVYENKTSTDVKRKTEVKDAGSLFRQRVLTGRKGELEEVYKNSGNSNGDLIKLTVAFLVSSFLAVGAVGTNLLEGFGEKLKGAIKFVLAFLSLFLGTITGAAWLSRPEEKALGSEEKFIG